MSSERPTKTPRRSASTKRTSREQRRDRDDGRVVALDVTDLEDASVLRGEVDEALRVLDRRP